MPNRDATSSPKMMKLNRYIRVLAIRCHLFPSFDSNTDSMPAVKQQYENIISDTLFEGLATKYIYDTNINILQIIFFFSLPSKCFSSEGSASNI